MSFFGELRILTSTSIEEKFKASSTMYDWFAPVQFPGSSFLVTKIDSSEFPLDDQENTALPAMNTDLIFSEPKERKHREDKTRRILTQKQ